MPKYICRIPQSRHQQISFPETERREVAGGDLQRAGGIAEARRKAGERGRGVAERTERGAEGAGLRRARGVRSIYGDVEGLGNGD